MEMGPHALITSETNNFAMHSSMGVLLYFFRQEALRARL
jgi:hypothetical protein